MKAIFMRELFWFILTIVISLLLSLFFMELVNLSSSSVNLKDIEEIFTVQLYIIGCIVSFICIYIIRIIIITVKAFLTK